MRRAACVILALLLLTSPAAAAGAEGGASAPALEVAAPSAILMEKTTGEVLYEKNADERRPPASVTKVMTMLLIAEAVDGGEITLSDEVTASAEAASMGGSQVWLEEGERMTVSDMLKCIAVVSANDCAVAMAEYISGSEAAFVERMNARAAELGMENTHFTNCTGLFDDEEHYTSARDIAVMSRELMLHGWIRDYTTIWMDSIRDGEFGLSNTNKLVRHYEGCTGLKTGFTSEAMYCLSATAEREGMELIAVIMHAESIESRNRDASTLLNYGFAGYELCALRPDGALDEARMAELISLADGCGVTLHRAFDVCADPFRALEEAKELRVNTILTSGQRDSAIEGAALLHDLVQAAGASQVASEKLWLWQAVCKQISDRSKMPFATFFFITLHRPFVFHIIARLWAIVNIMATLYDIHIF